MLLAPIYAALGITVGAGILFSPRREHSSNPSTIGIITSAYIFIAFIFRGYMSGYVMAGCAIVALSVFCRAVQYKAVLIAAWVSVTALAWSVSSALLFTGHPNQRAVLGIAFVPPAIAWVVAVVLFVIHGRNVKRPRSIRN